MYLDMCVYTNFCMSTGMNTIPHPLPSLSSGALRGRSGWSGGRAGSFERCLPPPERQVMRSSQRHVEYCMQHMVTKYLFVTSWKGECFAPHLWNFTFLFQSVASLGLQHKFGGLSFVRLYSKKLFITIKIRLQKLKLQVISFNLIG